MAILLTVLAVIAGFVLGVTQGGQVRNALMWRPVGWPLAVGALLLLAIMRLGGWSGWFAVLVDVLISIALVAFAVLNIRIGGMVLIVAGLALNLLPTVLNWGMPVRPGALVSADIVTEAQLPTVEVTGPRRIDGDATLGFLGETIPVSFTHQVISFGDLVLHVGYALVIASVLRRRRLRGGSPSYRSTIAPLGQGPMPRRGPATHPTRRRS